jgi:hypothetical protein
MAMRDYGFDAVRASLQTAQNAVSDNGVARAVFKAVLQVANALLPLKLRMFSAMGTTWAGLPATWPH